MTGIFLALLTVLALSGTASADLIFKDWFNRANSKTVGNGWIEKEFNGNDVAIVRQDQLLLRDYLPGKVDAAAYHAVDLSGYKDIEMTFKWRELEASEKSDKLNVSWTDTTGTTWTRAFREGLAGKDWEIENITDWKYNIDGLATFIVLPCGYKLFSIDLLNSMAQRIVAFLHGGSSGIRFGHGSSCGVLVPSGLMRSGTGNRSDRLTYDTVGRVVGEVRYLALAVQ